MWDALARWRAAGRRFVLATVVETRGFTPRKGGAHMLVAENGETFGTIGGGAIEAEVLAAARARLAEGGAGVVKRHLTRDLGMCCGGEMSVHLEVIEAAPALIVFGAGYIAKPLAAMAAGCGFDVTVVDARPEWANEERFPGARLAVTDPEAFARALAPTPSASVVVVTHDHALDQRIVQHLLDRPFRFHGMVGSVAKHRKFVQRLTARGFSADRIARLRTPLGLDIGAETPEEIAVSIVAELVAVRRGAPLAPRGSAARRMGEASRHDSNAIGTDAPASEPAEDSTT